MNVKKLLGEPEDDQPQLKFLVLGAVFDWPPLESQHKLGIKNGGWWPNPVTKIFTNACVSPSFPSFDAAKKFGANGRPLEEFLRDAQPSKPMA